MNKIHLALACAMHAFFLIGKFLAMLSANFCPMPFLTISDPLHVQNEVLVGSIFSLTTWHSAVCNYKVGRLVGFPFNAFLSCFLDDKGESRFLLSVRVVTKHCCF